ncbi:hypothetical protein EHS25_000855 [Saitozyma podzolica]|uniref:D-isomer specific 2-hydroxyacid dehydrogenase NAD-binding domain-containing protein n=1 Tax=Saitozyma podzolica TaxID=1890683 RepID=A0A427YXF5_9TREE|nr:hypothetical protein EHS25_000855 [Saitozyma podzolica]
MPVQLDNLVVTRPIPAKSLDQLRNAFKTLHYHPDAVVPRDTCKEADVWFNPYFALPDGITLDDVPNTKLIQLDAAGANYAVNQAVFRDPRAKDQFALCTASGIHVYTIPQHVISQVINLYTLHHVQYHLMRTKAVWAERPAILEAAGVGQVDGGSKLGSRSLYGKTAGLLGYGHIGREVARLLRAFNVEVIVANSDGRARIDQGYIVPGTGDKDGVLPSAYYSTNDQASFKEFLTRCDVLIASLPSTPKTRYLLTADHLKLLPDGAVFVNVGRGDLVQSEVLLEALDAPGGLSAMALDVTDPEPLPAAHPLFTHPKVILTPHISGDMEGYVERACDLFIANVEGVRAGKPPMNQVHLNRGY